MFTAQFSLTADEVKLEDYKVCQWKYKKKRPEKANLYIQVLQEDSMNCTVFHSKQVGATATIKKGEDTTSSNMHLV